MGVGLRAGYRAAIDRLIRAPQVRRSTTLTSGERSCRAYPGTSALAADSGAVKALGRARARRLTVLSPGCVRHTNLDAAKPDGARNDVRRRDTPTRSACERSIRGGRPSEALLASPYATGVVLDTTGG